MSANHFLGKSKEYKIVAKLLELGYEVFLPVVDNGIDICIRCDGNTWIKLQVKTFKISHECRKNKGKAIRRQFKIKKRTGEYYKSCDIDFFVAANGEDFFIIEFNDAVTRADNSGLLKSYTCFIGSRRKINNWDILPKPYSRLEGDLVVDEKKDISQNGGLLDLAI